MGSREASFFSSELDPRFTDVPPKHLLCLYNLVLQYSCKCIHPRAVGLCSSILHPNCIRTSWDFSQRYSIQAFSFLVLVRFHPILGTVSFQTKWNMRELQLLIWPIFHIVLCMLLSFTGIICSWLVYWMKTELDELQRQQTRVVGMQSVWYTLAFLIVFATALLLAVLNVIYPYVD